MHSAVAVHRLILSGTRHTGAGSYRKERKMVAQKVVEREGFFEKRVDLQTGQNSLHATEFIAKGSAFSPFGAKATTAKPTMYTLQASETEHIELNPEILAYTNHSCAPNVFYNTSDRVLEALEDIQPGDALTFFYPSTEFDMDSPFSCYCQSPCCLGRIQGAKHLDPKVLERYRLNAHIRRMLAKEQATA